MSRNKSQGAGPACRLPRGDRAGPLLLFVLLAAAFIPSVLTEFDSARLLAGILDAVSAPGGGPAALLPSGDAIPSAAPDAAVVPHAHSACGASAVTTVDAAARATAVLALPCGGRHEWPPGPASSPRAPPLGA